VRTEDDGRVLVVAMARPPSLEDVEKLSQATDRRIRIAIATDADVDRCLKKLYNVRRARAIEVARYQVRLEVAYRFVDKGWTEYVGGPSARGITGDVSRTGMKIVGPLPEGITKGRVEHEELQVEVRVRGLDDNAIRLACRPVRIDSGDRADIYTIGCIIEGFPEGEEAEWSQLMKQVSLQGFKPRPDRYEFE
jgi:hypothetical protein